MDNLDELKNSYHRKAPSGFGAGIKTWAAISAVQAAYKYNKAQQQQQQEDGFEPQKISFLQILIGSLLSGWGFIVILAIAFMLLLIVGFFIMVFNPIDSNSY